MPHSTSDFQPIMYVTTRVTQPKATLEKRAWKINDPVWRMSNPMSLQDAVQHWRNLSAHQDPRVWAITENKDDAVLFIGDRMLRPLSDSEAMRGGSLLLRRRTPIESLVVKGTLVVTLALAGLLGCSGALDTETEEQGGGGAQEGGAGPDGGWGGFGGEPVQEAPACQHEQPGCGPCHCGVR